MCPGSLFLGSTHSPLEHEKYCVGRTTIIMGSEYVSMGTYDNLSWGDVNPGNSRHGLPEDGLYCEIWTVLSIMRLDMIMHLGCGDLGMSCGPLPQVNMFS
jgi:hypothetical protein